MAFKTQVKLQQLTGTLGAGNDVIPAPSVGTTGTAMGLAVTTDIADVLQIYGNAIANIHGKSDFTSQTAGLIQVVDGNNYDIKLDQNDTGQAIVLESAGDKASSIYLHADAGTSETIKIHADQSVVDGAAGAGAIELTADAGGISLNAAAGKDIWAEAGRVILTANEDAADAVLLHADAGSSQTITVHRTTV